MKKLFGQKPKFSKTSSQASPIPTPIPVDQFARVASRGPSQDDNWVVIQDQTSVANGPFLQERSRSSSFASPPPFPQTTPSANNAAMYQHIAHTEPYGGPTHQSNQSLLQPNHNQ